MVAELGGVRQGLHGGESSESRGSKLDTGKESFDEGETVKTGELVDVLHATAVDDVGEEAGDRGREEALGLLVVLEADGCTVGVSRSLVVAETVRTS